MLAELTIRNFAIIDEIRVQFEPGLNVLTGETGAGKSIIIDAVGLLLGDRAQSDVVRAGTDRALVEGVFLVDERLARTLRPRLQERGLVEADDPLDTIILTREVCLHGQNICRINGRPVPLKLLQAVGEQFVDIHGQSEHLSLLRPRTQLRLLDRFAGTLDLRAQFAAKVAEWQTVRKDREALALSERELAQRVDRLTYIVEEIRQANLAPDEEETLQAERRLLANAERLALLSQQAYTLLYEGSDEQQAVLDMLGEVQRALNELARLDERLREQANDVQTAVAILDDVAHTLSDYMERVEYNPARLQEIERRLDQIFHLKRKYGDSIEEVLAVAARAEQELQDLADAEVRLAELREQEEALLHDIGRLGVELSRARREAARQLCAAVEHELRDLRLGHSRLDVAFTWQPSPEGAPVPDAFDNDPTARYAFDASGFDRIEFLVSTNPGEPLKPLARVASGGETARLMLALKTVLGHADETPTLIFDEIDTGIGGRLGGVVGRKLRGLAERHQVLCVTHLPQLAAFGDAHFRIHKVVEGGRTLTRVERLDEQNRLAELAMMLGTGESAWEAAVELRRAARQV